jgi:hypothetical protein
MENTTKKTWVSPVVTIEDIDNTKCGTDGGSDFCSES